MKDNIDGFDLSRKIQMDQRIIVDIFLATRADCVVEVWYKCLCLKTNVLTVMSSIAVDSRHLDEIWTYNCVCL